MKREIEVEGRKFIVRELLGIEVDDINFEDKKEAIRKQVTLSTGLTEAEYNQLTVKERLSIMNVIGEINFQMPKEEQKR
jgi:hypothetical protein